MINVLNVNLMRELGLDKLPEDKRQALVSQMTEVVGDRLTTLFCARLSWLGRRKLARLVRANGDVEAFLRTKIPDYDQLVTFVIADFKKEMLGIGAVVDEALAQQQQLRR